MTSKLSTDILSIIFEDIKQENDEALYSCILVNKEWCHVAIPFLWKNPWKRVKQDNKNKILFECFLKMMSKESKEYLKLNGIEDISSHDNHSPLFNYASFCKVIDIPKLSNMVSLNVEYSKPDYHQYLIEQEILKLLISNTAKLKVLKLNHRSYPIVFYPNSSISLSQLNELHCNTSIDSTLFYGLSQLCKNIERLVIEGHSDSNYGLISLIEQQINLKRVKIWKNIRVFSAQGQCKNLAEALSTRASSIIELDLRDNLITIPPTLIRKVQNNLTIFKFCISYNITEVGVISEFENILKEISLPNLQQLIIYCCPFKILAKLIERTKGELKKINIRCCHESEDANMLISTIAKHCPKLELLSVWIDDLDEILELIRACRNLRGLILQSFNDEASVDELFRVLYNDGSDQLRNLQLDNSWEISNEALNELLENWKQQQRSSLDLYIPYMLFRKNECEDIIKKYQELGVVRKFEKYNRTRNFLDNWG